MLQIIDLRHSQITQLERDLKESTSRFTRTERTFRESADQERRKLEEERAREAHEYYEKLKEVEGKHNEEISLLRKSKEQELKVRHLDFIASHRNR